MSPSRPPTRSSSSSSRGRISSSAPLTRGLRTGRRGVSDPHAIRPRNRKCLGGPRLFKWLRQTNGTDRGSLHPQPSAPSEDKFFKLVEKVSTLGEGQSVLGRTLSKVLIRVESIQSQAQSDFSALHTEIRRLSAPLEDLFSLADALNQLDEQLREPGICVFSTEELAATPLGKLAAQASGDEPSIRAQDMRRVLDSAFSRLDRHLALHGVTRVGVPGQTLDAHGLRAAKVLREGDVVVYRRLGPAAGPIEAQSVSEQNGPPVQPLRCRGALDGPAASLADGPMANGLDDHNALQGGLSGIDD